MKSSLFWTLAGAAAALAQPIVHAEAKVPAKREFVLRRSPPLVGRQNRLIPVVVGGPQDTFVPNLVRAAIGDVVQFQFSNGNHTVTQSSETAACQPLQLTNPTAVHSGHIPFQDGQISVGTFTLVVTSADPMFLYCATGPHCQEGQVMVINPTSDQQILNYMKLSAAAEKNVDGGAVSGGALGQIALQSAAFTPAPKDAGGPPGGAPPAAAPPAAAPPAAAPPAAAPPAVASPASTSSAVSTTTPPAETPAASTEPAATATPAA